MTGFVQGVNKEKLFATSDIFVFPTRSEVFGTVNIEAMNYSLPVVSSKEGEIPEIVQDGITGFLVNKRSPGELADKILILINDADLRKEMGIRGRKNFELKYTLEAHGKNIDNCLNFFLGLKKINKVRES